MAQPLRKTRPGRIFQDVTAQIQDAILSGRFRAGDVLPPERELKDLFKTSRGTLREALRVLEHKGLIEIRLGMGGGSVVRAITGQQVSESLALLIRSQSVTLFHLAEFREEVEGTVAALAAERAGTQDIARLRELLAEADRHLQPSRLDWDAFLRADEQFHLALARITGNAIFISVLQAVHENIHPYYERLIPRELGVLRENFNDLQAVADAVAARDGAAARRLAQDHVHRFRLYMARRLCASNSLQIAASSAETASVPAADERQRHDRFAKIPRKGLDIRVRRRLSRPRASQPGAAEPATTPTHTLKKEVP